MSLIDRQAAIDLVSYSIELCNKALDSITLGEKDRYAVRVERNSLLNLKDDIKLLPSAQPEIIRCKDCRYGVDYYHDGDCYCSNPKCELRYFGGSWEFYCADAERREE